MGEDEPMKRPKRMRTSANWMLTRAENAGGDEVGWKKGTFIFPKLLPVPSRKNRRDSDILPGNSPLSYLLPSFNHLSPSLPLISSPHSTLPRSPYQKRREDKGNI